MSIRSRGSSISREETHEAEPLLQDHRLSISSRCEDDLALHPKAPLKKGRLSIFVICVLLVTFGDFAVLSINIPLTRLYESIICYQYYEQSDPSRIDPGGNVPEQWCKIAPVQGDVALIRGYEALFTYIPGVILAIPYGLLADKWGRKPVVLLSVGGILLSMNATLLVCAFWKTFPLRLVWLAPAFSIIGGGIPVLSSMILTIIADIMPENERATAFFRIMTGQYLAQTTATPLSSTLMEAYGPWLPIQLGYICACITFLMACLLRETANPNPHNQPTNNPADEDSDSDSPPPPPIMTVPPKSKCLLAKTPHLYTQTTTLLLHHNPKLLLLTLTFFLNALEEPTQSLNIQYLSERYTLPLSRTSFIISLKALSTILVTTTLLPSASWILTQRLSLPEARKDLLLARISILMLSLGFFIVAWSPTVVGAMAGFVITTLGKGYGNLVRSLVTGFVPGRFLGRVYTGITVVETCGILVSGPWFAELFRVGLRLEGWWLGLPFVVAGGLGVVVAGVVWGVDLGEGGRRRDSDEEGC
ncbi:major facilitator superfamily domain-containing protein [Aspergillus alliaceus]|uniref:Major facilitator superfamily domain-containing protein n=1 Tax=Petromyces alliaceus TaxID=209559 RepID=A0A5N7CDR3_PETAA|nr:major facilitator superfamily domain-containing protein [Aspergillus alliaceus]